jgi:hypothetical protein
MVAVEEVEESCRLSLSREQRESEKGVISNNKSVLPLSPQVENSALR